ncbi:glycosyltransferase [Mesorhizobium xinjiangense]|uniref:glycosyltransferase n=1 Tax=Mesorhizobium xinjiangense TaxID=2678685 RepID=UPI0012EDF9CD|nr:glycosyltransferase [Mesorhizobium xinjiangense]
MTGEALSKADILQMQFTGERYVPELQGEIELEHIHRYLLACQLVKDKSVLDIACGEGYGSAILARHAIQVFGVDISSEAVDHARGKYSEAGIEFNVGSCSSIPLENNSVDVVVSFETIEHHDEHEQMMSEIKRVLRTDGVLIVSSPDKLEYSEKSGYSNPFHVKELYKRDFFELLSRYFKNFDVFGQRILYGSAIISERSSSRFVNYDLSEAPRSPDFGVARARYLIGVASDEELPRIDGGMLEQDIQASQVLKSWRQQLAIREHQLRQQKGTIDRLTQELAETREAAANLQERYAALEDRVETTIKHARQAALERDNARQALSAIQTSASWRVTRPMRTIRQTTTQLRTATAVALNLFRERQLTVSTMRRGITRLPALLREGRLSNPSSLAEMLESYSPIEADRVRNAFDSEYYLQNNPDVAQAKIDPFEHFMCQGWREGRDPSTNFSVLFYLRRYPDIARAGTNPFVHYILHGQREKRSPLPHQKRLERMEFQPKISVIVPNFNHARFLERRIDSILAQSYRNFEIIILDDCSSDDSRNIIESYRTRFPNLIRAIFNEKNSGNVFRQWRKGVENSEGDLAWICESDDFCEPDFLANLVPYFRDRSVNIAFGCIQFCNSEGKPQAGLDQYREGAEGGIWNEPLVRPAHRWFVGGFGVNNVIANVGGCIWRRQDLPSSVWEEAETFSVVGDWFLYCHLAQGGQIVFDPAAIAYFRQHGSNTSVSSFVTPQYYEEHYRLMALLRSTWGVPAATVEKFVSKVETQYRHFKLEKKLGPLRQYLDKDKLLTIDRQRPHILMAFLGFHSGGGEVFPINLANELYAKGHQVSMLALDMSHVNRDMLESLNPAIAVYDASWVAEIGADRFLSEAGISLIHSHMVSLEIFLFEQCRMQTRIPYLVTLHGSYESGSLEKVRLSKIVQRVTHWVYTADKNLTPIESVPLPEGNRTKLKNGMPIDHRPFPQTRAQMGIPKDAIVFTLVARGIPRKGWRASINAFAQLRDRHPEHKLHLLLCGEGEQADRHKEIHGTDPNITFLGYQSHIHGLYRLSDVAIVPTRFAGESFPLCVIQALQTGTPVISTRIGEIASMIEPPNTRPTGILLEPVRDTARFTKSLENAMELMLPEESRIEYSASAIKAAKSYKIENIADDYSSLYSSILEAAFE